MTLIITNAGKPNGILVSPDQATLYVAALDPGSLGALPEGMQGHPGRRALLAYDLDPDGSATFREEVVPDFGPDGMAIDEKGNLYLTRGSRVEVYSPSGEFLARIPVPETARNATFGRGAEARTLYITAGRSLYRIEVRNAGYDPRRRSQPIRPQ